MATISLDLRRRAVEAYRTGLTKGYEATATMDNLAAHKNRRAAEAIRAVGAEVLFLPPYSPDLNPIEKAWAKLKDSCVGYRP